MAGYETFYREEPIEVRSTRLPATLYNQVHTLLAQSQTGCVFVPIRSIQYMAVIDAEEIIFVDREAKHLVEVAWRSFRPQARTALDEPVPYEVHIYLKKAFEVMSHLQGAFQQALQQIDERHRADRAHDASAEVLPFQVDRPPNK